MLINIVRQSLFHTEIAGKCLRNPSTMSPVLLYVSPFLDEKDILRVGERLRR